MRSIQIRNDKITSQNPTFNCVRPLTQDKPVEEESWGRRDGSKQCQEVEVRGCCRGALEMDRIVDRSGDGREQRVIHRHDVDQDRHNSNGASSLRCARSSSCDKKCYAAGAKVSIRRSDDCANLRRSGQTCVGAVVVHQLNFHCCSYAIDCVFRACVSTID